MWPDGWEIQPPQERGAAMYLTARERRGVETLQTLELTAVGLARAASSMTADSIQELATSLMNVTAPNASEPLLSLQKFSTIDGYYFVATDKAPGPGDFKQLVAGVIHSQGYLLNFTLLTNDAYGPNAAAIIDALGRVEIR